MGTPFFIVGASRSGTTMMRLLLNGHRNIGVPKELSYFERCARHGYLEDWNSPGISGQAYRQFIHAFLNKKKLALEGIDIEALEERIVTQGPPNFARPFSMTMDEWIEQEGKTTWGEKTPKNLFYVDVIHQMIPEARFIYIVRDPRAVVYSMNRFARFEDDSVVNAFNWLQAATKGYDLLVRSIPEKQRMMIKYEELVSDVEQTARKLCAFVEEPFDEEMLEFYQKSRGNIHPHSVELGGVDTLTKPISTVSVDKWREGMSKKDIACVEAVCREAMERNGYECTHESLKGKDKLLVSLTLAYCQWQQRRNKHLRAYQIAFKPFEKTRSVLNRFFPKS